MSKFSIYVDVMIESYSGSHERIIDFENQQYNTNHAVIGYYVAKSWNLPKVLCDIIAEHHNCRRLYTSKTIETNRVTLTSILKMAEHICGSYKVLGRQEEDHEWDDIGKLVLEFLGFNDYDLDNFKETFAEMGISPNNYGLS
jgi:HD-like signal output (HDOD) protein